MYSTRIKAFAFAGCLLVALVGVAACGTAPIQEMSDARQALQAAREVDAQANAPVSLSGAEGLMKRAESALRSGDFKGARVLARGARSEAGKARKIALAIGAAREALAEARAVGHSWRRMAELLERAEEAAERGDAEEAVRLATEAAAARP